MEKLFVPYEIAKKLKDVEFVENCIAWWFNYGGEPHLHLVENDKGENNNFKLDLSESQAVNAKEMEEQYESSCSAPLYQQASSFFRDKLGYHIVAQPHGINKEYYPVINGLKHIKFKGTYNEALVEAYEILFNQIQNK